MTRLHVVSLPYSQTTAAWQSCAFTSKTVKFCRMMVEAGHHVTLYSGEQNDALCTEHVTIVSDAQQREWYGGRKPTDLIEHAIFVPADRTWVAANAAAVEEISRRAEPRDIVCLPGGDCQKLIADALPGLISCEHAVGYQGIFSDRCAFESYAWMHHLYGRASWSAGRWFDTVIPTMYEIDDFPRAETQGDYLLFMARLIHNGGRGKGLDVAVKVAQAAGRKLLIAGPGMESWKPARGRKGKRKPAQLIADGQVYEGDFEYIGVLGADRGKLLSEAYAFMAPTAYIEPFGGAAVEAMLCGTPVVSTDWGAFTETVRHGVDGFRIRNLQDGVDAVDGCGDLDRDAIRARARDLYSFGAVAPQYEGWFGRLSSLWGDGWNQRRAA